MAQWTELRQHFKVRIRCYIRKIATMVQTFFFLCDVSLELPSSLRKFFGFSYKIFQLSVLHGQRFIRTPSLSYKRATTTIVTLNV